MPRPDEGAARAIALERLTESGTNAGTNLAPGAAMARAAANLKHPLWGLALGRGAIYGPDGQQELAWLEHLWDGVAVAASQIPAALPADLHPDPITVNPAGGALARNQGPELQPTRPHRPTNRPLTPVSVLIDQLGAGAPADVASQKIDHGRIQVPYAFAASLLGDPPGFPSW
jgi:hypothetical protein